MSETKQGENKSSPTDYKVTGDEFVSGFALSGDYVKNMPDKTFVIMGQKTVLVPDLGHPEELKKKLILSVKIADGSIIDYYPNKTSQKTVIANRGMKLSNWIGYKGKFTTATQMVGQNKREVIYIEGVA